MSRILQERMRLDDMLGFITNRRFIGLREFQLGHTERMYCLGVELEGMERSVRQHRESSCSAQLADLDSVGKARQMISTYWRYLLQADRAAGTLFVARLLGEHQELATELGISNERLSQMIDSLTDRMHETLELALDPRRKLQKAYAKWQKAQPEHCKYHPVTLTLIERLLQPTNEPVDEAKIRQQFEDVLSAPIADGFEYDLSTVAEKLRLLPSREVKIDPRWR